MSKETTTTKVKVPFYKKGWVNLIAGFVIGAIVFSGANSDATETTGKITDEKSAEVETPAKKEVKKAPEKEPTVVFQNDKIVVSFKEVSAEGIKFLVENKTDKALTFQSDSLSVNGFSANNIMMSDEVAPKSKGYITAMTDELADVGTPTKVSGKMSVIDFSSANADFFDITFTDKPVN